MGQADPGSFRDPASHVVLGDDSVTRLLDERGVDGWQALSATTFMAQAVADRRLISSTEVSPPDGAAGALQHPRIPVITYPFEWTFSMLRDAALLQLDLMEGALAEGLVLKDATPYNVQFVAGRPMFIDIGSFERYRPGDPWVGYRQFCRQFLYPLMLRAWVGVAFQPWLRGDPEGPTADQMRRLLPARRRLSPTGLLHVELQARAENRLQGEAVRASLAEAGFTAEMIVSNVRKLRALIQSLEWGGASGTWADYVACDHVGRDRAAKSEFLAKATAAVQPAKVLDLGANDGHFSQVAVDGGAMAVAVDGDEEVLDRLYRSLPSGTSIVPVLADLSNPSPAQGWAGVERPSLFQRADPDLVVAYGLIHHLIYTASIPPALVVSWLAGFGVPVVVEFVGPDDPMVARLTSNKRPEELHPDRDQAAFERLAAEHFATVTDRGLEGGTRRLYHLIPR
ncbi:MAG TPA: methyltransferase [Acidimicrobiia bacterium]|nr:methyltransferase [Acidimicrobiia bacterium]